MDIIWEDWEELHFTMLEPMSSLETKALHFVTQDFSWALFRAIAPTISINITKLVIVHLFYHCEVVSAELNFLMLFR